MLEETSQPYQLHVYKDYIAKFPDKFGMSERKSCSLWAYVLQYTGYYIILDGIRRQNGAC